MAPVQPRNPFTGLLVRAAFSLFALSALLAAPAAAVAEDLRIEQVTIISPQHAAPVKNATVTVHDERIVSITTGSDMPAQVAGARILDGRGLYLAPGLIDSHVHLVLIPGMTPQQEQAHPAIAHAAREQIPRSYLYFGYTTLIDLVSTPEWMQQWEAHSLRPDTYFCGAAPVLDGYPMNSLPKPERYREMPYFLLEAYPGSAVPPGIDAAAHTPEAVVRRIKAAGARCVKTFFERGFGGAHDLPLPKLTTIRALVRAAHAAHLPVLMHANSSEAQRFAVAAGVDIIAHGLWNWDEPLRVTTLTPAVEKILDDVIAAKMGWQPTIQVLDGLRGLFDPGVLSDPLLAQVLPASLIEWYRTPEGQWFHDQTDRTMVTAAKGPRAHAEQARQIFGALITRDESAVRYMAQHGGRILFGTDTPSAPTYANAPGLNGWLEMHRLAEAGMTPAQIFRAATIVNAEALGLSEVGTIAVGKRANLLLLRADPSQTIEAYDDIADIILHGRVIDRITLRADRLQ